MKVTKISVKALSKIIVLVALFITSTTAQAQTEQEKRLRELEALQAELENLDDSEKKREAERDSIRKQEQRVRTLMSQLSDLNYAYREAYQAGDQERLDVVIDSIRWILKDPEFPECDYTAQLVVANICDYYSALGDQQNFEATLELLPGNCGMMVNEYIRMANYLVTGKQEEAAGLLEQAAYQIPESCLKDSLTLDCFYEIRENIHPDFAGRYLINLSLIYKSTGEEKRAISHAKAALQYARYTKVAEEEFVAALSLAALYFTASEINKVYEVLDPYKEKVDQFLWSYQKEYHRLMAAVAANKGDQSEQQKSENKMTALTAAHGGVQSLEDRINRAFRAFRLQETAQVLDVAGFEGDNALESLVKEMEARQEYNSTYYTKAILMLAASYENSVSIYNMKDPGQFLLEKLTNISADRNKALIYYYLGEKKYRDLEYEAFEYLEKALAIFEQHEDKVSTFKTRQMLAFMFDAFDMNQEAITYYQEVLQEAGSLIRDYYPYLTEKEQYYFNVQWIHQLEKSVFSMYPNLSQALQAELKRPLLKFRLQTKGLLLQNSARTRQAMQKSDDPTVKETFVKMTQLKEELSMHQEDLDWKGKQDLADQIEQLEAEINIALGLKTDYRYTDFSIRDIQESLDEGEYAVEVVRTQVTTGAYLSDTINYTYFIIPPTGEVEVLTLRDQRELEEKSFNYYVKAIQYKIKDEQSYSRYWSAIEDKLSGASIVYISVDGIYNGINLGALLNPASGKYLYEKTTLIQLSSLRDMLQKSQKRSLLSNKSIFIGRPKYFLNDQQNNSSDRGAIIADLPGTEKEILTISERLQEAQLPFEKHLGEAATESLVKRVNSPGVLHIATHGYFEKPEEDDLFDSPMLASGLLLTGAGDQEASAGEDGILTAYEITSIDLSETELVVLSACESGVGENRDGQGVYGLSRAFFEAGSQAVVSSLWKVDDTATQKFMELFYYQWLNNHDLRKSMTYARNELRKKYPEPYYWGAFVATGGL